MVPVLIGDDTEEFTAVTRRLQRHGAHVKCQEADLIQFSGIREGFLKEVRAKHRHDDSELDRHKWIQGRILGLQLECWISGEVWCGGFMPGGGQRAPDFEVSYKLRQKLWVGWSVLEEAIELFLHLRTHGVWYQKWLQRDRILRMSSPCWWLIHFNPAGDW